MLFKIRKSDVSTHYHNTRTFLNKYRDISWILEVSDLNLQKEFKTTYELFTDSPLVASEVKDGGNPPENYTYALVRSKKMMQLTDTAIDLMRRKHKKGEFYYWILYYTYLAPHHYANNYEILHFLELKGMPMSMRNYYLRREEAINVLSSVLWGYTSTDCEELINRLLPE